MRLETEAGPLFVVSRRVHRRASLRVDIELWYAGRKFEGMTRNVSEGGVYLVTGADLPLGAEVELALRIPGCLAAHQIRARVAWGTGWARDGQGYGLTFVALSGFAVREIAIFVANSVAVGPTAS